MELARELVEKAKQVVECYRIDLRNRVLEGRVKELHSVVKASILITLTAPIVYKSSISYILS
jgi:uncharacterized membrane protein